MSPEWGERGNGTCITHVDASAELVPYDAVIRAVVNCHTEDVDVKAKSSDGHRHQPGDGLDAPVPLRPGEKRRNPSKHQEGNGDVEVSRAPTPVSVPRPPSREIPEFDAEH